MISTSVGYKVVTTGVHGTLMMNRVRIATIGDNRRTNTMQFTLFGNLYFKYNLLSCAYAEIVFCEDRKN